ncbi:SMI1/KNR4 family protein [Burkholderia sp. LMG 32019]|uniref:SMI1/KNR4 family protein n=1 Tax=Burkholderia sp. LMG 32019 TaxID=3158173 RepID=UPI003C2BE6EE
MLNAIFAERMNDREPALIVKFHIHGNIEEQPRVVAVNHRLYPAEGVAREAALQALEKWPGAKELVAFYSQYDGFDFCRAYDVRYDKDFPLIEMFAVHELLDLTERYGVDGDRAYAVDFNKSRNLYRGNHSSWIVFGEVNGGANALATFLDGEHAGQIFFIETQPHFNTLRPIAKSFDALLRRMGTDPAAFLRLVRATVCLRGEDHWHGSADIPNQYGFTPVGYLESSSAIKE